jgi:two-component system LytT family response regulator
VIRHNIKYDIVFFECEEVAAFDSKADMLNKIGVQLIVISNNPLLAARAFSVRALDFLSKPLELDKIVKAISYTDNYKFESVHSNDPGNHHPMVQRYLIKDRDKLYWVKLEDVFYFEAVGNYVKIHLSSATPVFYRTLAHLEKRIPPSLFFRANRSCLVNLNCVYDISTSKRGLLVLQMENKTQIELSQRQSTVFRGMMAL